MTEFLNRIFGGDVQAAILKYFNEMKTKGGKFAQEMKFSGKLLNPSQAILGFSKAKVDMTLAAQFEVEGGQVYITDAVVTPDVPWFKKYFFFCKQGKHQFSFPNFPSVADLKAKWCQPKKDSKELHPEGREWCATDDKIWDDYFMYGEPYPESLQDCAVVRSLEVYNFHFESNSDGIDVESDIRYDLRFRLPVLGYKHLDNNGKIKRGYDISKYFVGGLMLGGAWEDFKKFLAKTRANVDCTPALNGLLQSMMAPRLAMR